MHARVKGLSQTQPSPVVKLPHFDYLVGLYRLVSCIGPTYKRKIQNENV
jgi:hypothetical protein